jgi:hypothetical protein
VIFGTWNVRSLYRSGSPTTATRELERYKLDTVGIQEIMWDKRSTVKLGDYILLYEKGNKKSSNGNRSFCTRRTSVSS